MSLYWYRPRKIDVALRKLGYDIETFFALSRIFPDLIAPRTESVRIPLPIVIDPSSRIPDISAGAREMTFEDCCAERAEELLRLSETRGIPLYIFLSGGIDSTTIVSTFLKHFSRERLRDKLKIVTSPECWIENPDFVRRYLVGTFEFISARGMPHFFDGRAFIVTGDMNEYYLLKTQEGPWGEGNSPPYSKDAFADYLASLGVQPEHIRVWVEIFDRDRASSPVPVDTLEELLWWIRFNWTWQLFKFQILMAQNPLAPHITTIGEFTDRIRHFYDSPSFQLWGMHNPDRSPRKNACRALIKSFTGETEWIKRKRKFNSFANILRDHSTALGVDERFNLLYDPEEVAAHRDPHNDFA